MQVGVVLWDGIDARDAVECVRLAERRGLPSAWVAEGHGGDDFSILAACALSTRKISLGTSIVSVFVHSPPTIAMGAVTVDAVARGRFHSGWARATGRRSNPSTGCRIASRSSG
jgi:5,10-methylenetetrahydromethanopterin reductase